MKHRRKKIFYFLFLLVFFEAAFRLFISVYFETSFFRPDQAWLHYYPELRPVLQLPEPEKFRLLVLGGSVVYDDTIPIHLEGKDLKETFCNVPWLIARELADMHTSTEIEVISVAQPAHNSLDSRYKYEYLQSVSFDQVFLYHGINDTRTNNIPREKFDPDYRHIEFYNDLFVIRRHPEIKATVIPFFLDFLIQKIAVGTGIRTTIPREHFEDFESEEAQAFLREGSDLKSVESFKRNVEDILYMAKSREEKLVLATYAWYLPEDYSLEKFQKRELDYDGQIFPTEIYGLPENVKAGLIAHNEVIRTIAAREESSVRFRDILAQIPQNGEYFDDICHLSDLGCLVLGDQVLASVLGYTGMDYGEGKIESSDSFSTNSDSLSQPSP